MGCRVYMIFIQRVPLDFICDFSRGEDPLKDGQLANFLIIQFWIYDLLNVTMIYHRLHGSSFFELFLNISSFK